MRILHTSDWHLGKKIHNKETYLGTQSFLNWLRDEIYDKKVDCLIVAGDIFNTSTPTNQAQTQYYRFLASLVGSPCKSVVVIAGNHDSASLITAPKEVLKYLNVHVAGVASSELEDQVIEVKDETGNTGAVIGLIPFLRERDVYHSEEMGGEIDIRHQIIKGTKQHYQNIYQKALQQKGKRNIPIVLTGHIFATGANLSNDREREAYVVGNLDEVPFDVFPEGAAYIALGHIHRPQILKKDNTRNYSGAPYPMDFKEVGQQKYVRIVDFSSGHTQVQSVEVPEFIKLVQLEGNLEEIKQKIAELGKTKEELICEAIVNGETTARQTIMNEIKEATNGTLISVVKFTLDKDRQLENMKEENEDNFEMTVETVFQKRLELEEQRLKPEELKAFEDKEKKMLWRLYRIVLSDLAKDPQEREIFEDSSFMVSEE